MVLGEVVSLPKFEVWYHQKLEQKYITEMDSLYMILKPILVYYSTLSELCGSFSDALQESRDEQLLGFRKEIESVLKLIQMLVCSFPTCIDASYTESFCRLANDCYSNICRHMSCFSRTDLVTDKYDLQSMWCMFGEFGIGVNWMSRYCCT